MCNILVKKMSSLGQRLSQIRKKRSQQQFADCFQISRSTYANYEQGKFLPDAKFLNMLHQKFGVNLNWLMTGEGEMYERRGNVENGIRGNIGNGFYVENNGSGSVVQTGGRVEEGNVRPETRDMQPAREAMRLVSRIISSKDPELIKLAVESLTALSGT